jgi:anti-sigma regulatory factor (Ser/Thr protein kinase)
MTIEYRARLPAEPDAPARARRLVRCLDGGAELVENLELLVTELVTNSVRHAGVAPDGWVELELRADDDMVRVEVIDPGRGFDPARVGASQPVRGSGWGLVLVERIARRWGVHHDALTRVWFELPLDDQPVPAGPKGSIVLT